MESKSLARGIFPHVALLVCCLSAHHPLVSCLSSLLMLGAFAHRESTSISTAALFLEHAAINSPGDQFAVSRFTISHTMDAAYAITWPVLLQVYENSCCHELAHTTVRNSSYDQTSRASLSRSPSSQSPGGFCISVNCIAVMQYGNVSAATSLPVPSMKTAWHQPYLQQMEYPDAQTFGLLSSLSASFR